MMDITEARINSVINALRAMPQSAGTADDIARYLGWPCEKARRYAQYLVLSGECITGIRKVKGIRPFVLYRLVKKKR